MRALDGCRVIDVCLVALHSHLSCELFSVASSHSVSVSCGANSDARVLVGRVMVWIKSTDL